MKVLLVNAVNGISSTGRTVLELARGLEQRGVSSRIAHSAGQVGEQSYVIGTAVEKKLHALGSRVFGTQAYFSHAGTRRLLDYIETESPDVVHLHNLHGNFVHLPMLLEYLARRDIATVVQLDDCWFYTGKCCHYTSAGCYRWQTGCGSCPRLAQDNRSWLFDATARMWSDKRRLFARIPRLAVVGVSDWIVDEARRSFLTCAHSLRRIYNWIDTDTFRPIVDSRSALGWSDGFVVLGVASRWGDDKGLSDFIALAEMLQGGLLGAQPHEGAGGRTEPRIVLVGDIKNGVRLPKSIEHVRSTADTNELARYYAAADVFLQLSREETFGKVTAEALACGTPAIVYDSTANPEVIGDGCGYVVAQGDLAQVIDRIGVVRDNSKDTYSARCCQFAHETFSMADRIEDHLSVYRDLCRMRRIL